MRMIPSPVSPCVPAAFSWGSIMCSVLFSFRAEQGQDPEGCVLLPFTGRCICEWNASEIETLSSCFLILPLSHTLCLSAPGCVRAHHPCRRHGYTSRSGVNHLSCEASATPPPSSRILAWLQNGGIWLPSIQPESPNQSVVSISPCPCLLASLITDHQPTILQTIDR